MSIRQMIEDTYAAYRTRDLEGTMKAFADTVEYDWPVDSETGHWAGRCRGRDAFIKRLEDLAETFEFLDVKVIDILVDGNKAASRVAITVRSKKTGAELTNHSGHFWRFEGGACVEFCEYYDSALIGKHSA